MSHAAPIFVAGKSGQLARCLAEAGSRRNVRVVLAGRPDFDLTESQSVDRALDALGPGVIINAAAYTAVDKAESEPDRCYAVNCDAAERLAAAVWRRRLPFVHISTDYVFDGEKLSPYREDDATAPLGVYGRSKLQGEQAVLAAHPEALILRTAWVYSAFGANFLTTMLKLAESRPCLRVVDDQLGCPTSAHDLAAALVDMACKLRQADAPRCTGVYHLSGTGQTTWYGLAAKIFAHAEKRGQRVPDLKAIPTAEYPTPAPRPRNSALDCEKFRRAFGTGLPPWSTSVTDCVDRLMAKELQPC
jgi:dTDP-4-dehydrorhamnose reductase